MDTAGPLLETKLYLPRRRRELVPRPRLRQRLDQGAESKATLVSAPAGFGKTTLLGDWLEGWAADAPVAPAGQRCVAWLSLDERDDGAATFWIYVIAALRRAVPGIGATTLSLFQSPQPLPAEVALAPLLNELAAVPHDVVLVLDDYHAVESADVQEGMAFLLDHLPPPVHLVIGTRADPSLPLARLRARGELVELRAADLRFTPDEAAAYLNEVMGLGLAAQDIAALEGRTEGWIAALQLAALSMRGRDDVAGFIAGFAGDERYIVDYLVEEVLQRQPERVRTFLLQTSILGRLSGPLCDAVTGRDGGRARIEALDRSNLFVVPLDDRRRWYRYHHLFADVLRAHVAEEHPEEVAALHQRASQWYELNGERQEAIRHAFAAEDYERAADLVELAAPSLRRDRQEATLLGWFKTLPSELFRRRPVLGNEYAGALMASGALGGVDTLLRDAERWLESMPVDTPAGAIAPAGALEHLAAGPDELVVLDRKEYRRLPGAIAVHRAGLALTQGDLGGTVGHARRALDLLPESDQVGRGAAAALLGLASWTGGHLEAAHQAYAEARNRFHTAGYLSDVLGCSIALADMRIGQGRLREAVRTFEYALQLTSAQSARSAQGVPAPRGTADMHVGLAGLLCEQDHLEAAEQHLLKSQELGEHTALPQNAYRWRVAMARIRQAQGDLGGALALLDEAERVYNGDFSPNVRPIAALRARVWVTQDRIGDALGWARERSLSAGDEPSYLRECEHTTLARALIAHALSQGDGRAIEDAAGLLERLLRAAEEGERTGSVIEILLLQALVRQVEGSVSAALVPLERALALAEPEGYVRLFVDEGPPIAALLEQAYRRGIASGYARRLLAMFTAPAAAGNPEGRALAQQGLVEPLSARELDVLRLLGTDLDGADIARQLVVSLNTMRTHTKNIYGKLGVNTRRAAVRRAEELNLLPRT